MRPKLAIGGVFVLIFLGTLIPVIRAVYITRTTGDLRLSTNSSTATLAITGIDKQAVYIGQGSTNVRLAPGTYLVNATGQGASVSATVQISKQQTITKTLDIEGQIKAVNKYSSLTSKLPVSGPASTYNISYYVAYKDGEGSLVFTVASTTPAAKLAAQQWFEYYGFTPWQLPIQYSTEQISTVPDGPNSGLYYFGNSNVND